VQVSFLVLAGLAAAARSPRIDRIAVSLLLIILIGGQLIFRINPGGYFSG
jgi:hypothetical protein